MTPALKKRLESGEIESATLAEMLAIDLGALLRTVLPDADDEELARVREGGITRRMAAAGEVLLTNLGKRSFDSLRKHRSDLVRGFSAHMVLADRGATLAQRLDRIRPLADDANSGVREWAWIAVRPAIIAEPKRAIEILTEWTSESSPNLRRFASESTRPRGVWCAHIGELKAQPSPGLAVLEPLRADGHKYVQDSVANWLNDAGKTCPDWVLKVCASWGRGTPPAATGRIIRRALRNL